MSAREFREESWRTLWHLAWKSGEKVNWDATKFACVALGLAWKALAWLTD